MTYNRGRNIVYNSINKPTYLTNKKGQKVSFYYGVGGQRYMKTNGKYATYYIGKLYEEKVGNGYSIEKDYIYSGGKLVGTHTGTRNLHGGSTSYANLYFHTDALGSITAISNASGTVIERRSYDPFGEIRSMNYKTNNNTLTNITKWTDRAYTGHEQISELDGLVHMNARLYDNVIGRFLSADTIIQAPNDSQSYNRYSYVRNNPLMYTDPSGHSWLSKAWKKIKTVVIVVVVAVLAVYTGGLALGAFGFTVSAATAVGFSSAIAMATSAGAFGAIVASGAVAGFAAGVAGGLLNGATLGQSMKAGFKGALWGAVSAGVANGIGTAFSGGGAGAAAARSLAHGLTRAAISKAQGGKYSEGFWSGFASSALGGTIGQAKTVGGQMTLAAIVGGTASKLGGKFANGAVSGAFVHMYNHAAHAWVGGESASSATKKILDIHPQGERIIAAGLKGLFAGAIGGGMAGSVVPGVGNLVGVVMGGIAGLATGLMTGVTLEIMGAGQVIEDTSNMITNTGKGYIEHEIRVQYRKD